MACGELEVAALASRFCSQEQLRRAAKPLDRGLLLHAGQSAVEDGHVVPCAAEPLDEHLLRGSELREDDHLVVEIADEAQQAVDLRTFRLLRCSLGQPCQAVAFGGRQPRLPG